MRGGLFAMTKEPVKGEGEGLCLLPWSRRWMVEGADGLAGEQQKSCSSGE